MLNGLPILIVEDQPIVAHNLCEFVEMHGGRVVGPIESVAGAMALVDRENFAAAILDANLVDRDVTPLAEHLLEMGAPFVIFTGTGLPDALRQSHPSLPVVMKPAQPEVVLNALLAQLQPQQRVA